MSLTACKTKRGQTSRELVVFTLSGRRPFQDSVVSIDTAGGTGRTILKPSQDRSFLSYSATSLERKAVVLAHEASDSAHAADKLYVYLPKISGWEPLLDGVPDYQGSGILSSDESRVVFALANRRNPMRYELWTKNLNYGDIKQITHIDEDSSWDTPLGWAPDNSKILFLRYVRTPRGITSSLLEISSGEHIPRMLFGASDAVFAAAFSPDGKSLAVLSRNGIELVDDIGMTRRVVLDRAGLGEKRYRSGGLCWSPTARMIVFELYDSRADHDEIIVVPTSGEGMKILYSAERSSIHHMSVIRETEAEADPD